MKSTVNFGKKMPETFESVLLTFYLHNYLYFTRIGGRPTRMLKPLRLDMHETEVPEFDSRTRREIFFTPPIPPLTSHR